MFLVVIPTPIQGPTFVFGSIIDLALEASLFVVNSEGHLSNSPLWLHDSAFSS